MSAHIETIPHGIFLTVATFLTAEELQALSVVNRQIRGRINGNKDDNDNGDECLKLDCPHCNKRSIIFKLVMNEEEISDNEESNPLVFLWPDSSNNNENRNDSSNLDEPHENTVEEQEEEQSLNPRAQDDDEARNNESTRVLERRSLTGEQSVGSNTSNNGNHTSQQLENGHDDVSGIGEPVNDDNSSVPAMHAGQNHGDETGDDDSLPALVRGNFDDDSSTTSDVPNLIPWEDVFGRKQPICPHCQRLCCASCSRSAHTCKKCQRIVGCPGSAPVNVSSCSSPECNSLLCQRCFDQFSHCTQCAWRRRPRVEQFFLNGRRPRVEEFFLHGGLAGLHVQFLRPANVEAAVPAAGAEQEAAADQVQDRRNIRQRLLGRHQRRALDREDRQRQRGLRAHFRHPQRGRAQRRGR